MILKPGLFLALVATAGSLPAAVILSDDFESYSATAGGFTTYAAGSSFGPWTVESGSIDIVNNFPPLTCHSGAQCLDMDGSTNQAGAVFGGWTFTAGTTYTVNFWYAGNGRGGPVDSMDITLGTALLSLTNIDSAVPWTQASLSYTAASTGPGVLRFAHSGGDFFGILLDDVALSDSVTGGAVPEPGTFGLAMVGALLIAWGRGKFLS